MYSEFIFTIILLDCSYGPFNSKEIVEQVSHVQTFGLNIMNKSEEMAESFSLTIYFFCFVLFYYIWWLVDLTSCFCPGILGLSWGPENANLSVCECSLSS